MKLAVFAAVAGVALGIGLDRTVLAQADGLKRTILQTTDDPGNPKYQAIMALSELAPGATAAKHRHHGVEIGYVLDGAVTIEQDGRPPTTYKAGQALENVAPHSAKNAGTTAARVLAVYLVEKGQPLSEPVGAPK